MNFRVLTPYQVAAIEKPKGKGRKVPKGAKRPRSHNLACYIPPGAGQSTRRITGAHLEPDSPEMEAASVYFASGLLQASQAGGHSMVRSLVGPARYSDRILARYCQHLIKGALGKPNLYLENPISPALVPYLLGGMPWSAVESVGHRAMELMDFLPEPLGAPTLHRVFSSVGFGPDLPHSHYDALIDYGTDNQPYAVEVKKKQNHLSFRQDYLLNLPREGSYASLLIRHGAYEDGLRRLLSSWKPQIMAEAERELDPAGGEMSERAAKDRFRIAADDGMFKLAVNAVFRADWDKLDLKAGGQENAHADMVTLMARKIIHRLTYNDKAKAEHLLGMSLLTGISIASWTNYAVADRARRGETFITDDELERLIEMAEAHPACDCGKELRDALMVMRYTPESSASKEKWARRLRSARAPLWSTNGLYYLRGFDEDGAPICKPKAFEAYRSDVD